MASLLVQCATHVDEIALLAPSPSALRLMLKHCDFSRGLLFNACSAIMLFSGVSLSFVDTVVHLGHILSFDNSDTADILCKARDLVRKANLMMHTFSAADPPVKSCLLQFYCLSLYGCSLWNLSCHLASYPAVPAFFFCKRKKLGRLGSRLPATHSAQLKFPSIIIFSGASGVFHVTVILESCISLRSCPAFST